MPDSLAAIGDLHLGKLAFIHDHLERQIAHLDGIAARIRDSDADKVVLLGDVFDKPAPPPATVMAFISWIVRHRDLRFDWIAGNHDRTSSVPAQVDVISMLAETGLLDNLTVHLEPSADGEIGFLPFPHKTPLPDTILSFGHVNRPGARTDNGWSVPDGDWNEKHWYVLGHIHTAQKKGRTWYPGSPWQLSFGEYGDLLGWAEIRMADKPRYRFVETDPPYRLRRVHVESEDDLGEIPGPNDFDWFSLSFDPGIDLPDGFLQDNPHCRLANSPRKRAEAVEEDAVEGLDLMEMLERFLRGRGLSENDVRWAMKKTRELDA